MRAAVQSQLVDDKITLSLPGIVEGGGADQSNELYLVRARYLPHGARARRKRGLFEGMEVEGNSFVFHGGLLNGSRRRRRPK
jgi:hypothetical protein